MPKLAMIAAIAENRAIGNENKLLYWLPDDLKRFKQLTTGHTIIMGSNTFRSLPKGALPNRRNIVLSRRGAECPGAELFPSLEEALESCASEETVYIIGGEKLYSYALPHADILYLTEIKDTPEQADAFFPDWKAIGAWQESEREPHVKDEKHSFEFDFTTYIKAQ